MKKIFWAITITILLLCIVIGEQIFVDNTITTLLSKINILENKVTIAENIKQDDIIANCTVLDKFWTEREKILCLFINHNDLNKVGEQIKRVKAYVNQNKKDECECELDTLKFYAESYKHVMEINIQNLL